MKKYTVYTSIDSGETSFFFTGKNLPERERPNWHYYKREDGAIIHFRKDHMVCVIEEAA